MKKVSMLLPAFLLAVAAVALAADFSGTWVLDKAKSDPMRGGRGGQQARADMNVTLVITQAANDITITRKLNMGGQERSSDMKYSLDGKEATMQAPMGRGERVAKASMNGDTLVIQGTQKNPRGEFPFKEELALSDGGKTLTITTTQGERTRKEVYNRQ